MPSLTALVALDSAFLTALFYTGYVGSHLPAILFFILSTLFSESRLSNGGKTWLVSPRWLVLSTLIWSALQLVLILIFTFAASLSDLFLQWMQPRRDALDACGIYVPEVTGWYEFCLSLISCLIMVIVCGLNLYFVHGKAKFHTLMTTVAAGMGDADDDLSFPAASSSASSRPNLGTVTNFHNSNNNEEDDHLHHSYTAFSRESTATNNNSNSALASSAASTANLTKREKRKLLKQQKEKEEQEREETLASMDVERNPPHSGLPLLLCWAALCALGAVVAPSYLAFPLFFIYILVVGVAVLSPQLNRRGGGSGTGDSRMLLWACYASLYYSSCLAALVMGAQNSLARSSSDQELGLASWRELIVESKDDSSVRNIFNAFFLFLTVVVSRALIYTSVTASDLLVLSNKFKKMEEEMMKEEDGSSTHQKKSHRHKKQQHHHLTEDIDSKTTSWMISSLESSNLNAFTVWVVDFLLTNGPFWIFPIFVVTCVSSPTSLSVILLIVLFIASLNFKFFTAFAPSFYVLCAVISISVYFVNIITREVPVAVKIVIANRDRDGAALPLIFQGAASGFAAISFVFFRFAEFVARDNDRKNNMKSAAALSKLKNIYWLGDGEELILRKEADLVRKVETVMKKLKESSSSKAGVLGENGEFKIEAFLKVQDEIVFQAAKEFVPALTEEEFEEELKPLLLVASGIEPDELALFAADNGSGSNSNNSHHTNSLASFMSSVRNLAVARENGTTETDDQSPSHQSSVPMLSVTAAEDEKHKTKNENSDDDNDDQAPSLKKSFTSGNQKLLSALRTRSRAASQIQQRKHGSSFMDPKPLLRLSSSSSSPTTTGTAAAASSSSALAGNETDYTKFEDDHDNNKKNKNDDDEQELLTTRTFNNSNSTGEDLLHKKIEDNNDGMLYRQSAIRHFLISSSLESAKRKLLVEVFVSLLFYVLRFGTYALCVSTIFAVATCQPNFDTFHLPLLLFVITSLSIPTFALALWPAVVIYLMILSTWRFVLASLNTGTVLQDWQGRMDVRAVSLLGIDSKSQYILYLYIAAALLSVAEWRLQRNRHIVTLEQWLSHRYDRKLISDPRVVRFYRLIGLGCLILVLGYRAVFERSILFLLIMILFFILSGLITFTEMRLTALWNIGVVLSSIMLLLEATFQIVIAASPDYNWDADCDPGSICAKDLGLLRHDSYFSLTAALLPSFLSIAFFAAMSTWSKADSLALQKQQQQQETEEQAKERQDQTSTSLTSTAAAASSSSQSPPAAPSNSTMFSRESSSNFASGGTGEETEFTSLGFERIFTFLLGILNVAEQLLLANLRFVVWGTLVFASVFNPGVNSFVYALVFIFDVRGFTTSVISGLHMLIIYFLRFSLVSGHFTDYTRDVMLFIGWMPKTEDETWKLLLGPMLCFVSSLCYENMERFSARKKKQEETEKEKMEGSATKSTTVNNTQEASLLQNKQQEPGERESLVIKSQNSLPPSVSTASRVRFEMQSSLITEEITHHSSGDDDDSSSSSGSNNDNDDDDDKSQLQIRPRKGTLSRIEQLEREKEDKMLAKLKQEESLMSKSSSSSLGASLMKDQASTTSSATYFSMIMKKRKLQEEQKRRFESMRKVPESVSSIILMIRDFVRSCSYELLLLTHLIGSAVCINHVTGLLHVMQVTIISFVGRVAVTSKPSITLAFVVFESFLFISQAAIAMEPFLLKLVLQQDDEPSEWVKYLGLGEAQVLSIWTALSLIILRVMQQLHQTSNREFDTNRKLSNGFATLQEMLRARQDIQNALDDTVTESEAHEQLLDELLAGSDKVPPSSVIFRKLITFTTYVLPTAVLTFFEGLGSLSMINAIIIFSGLVMLSNQRRIHWRNHILWNRWIWFCDLIPWLASICNMPPVAAYLTQHHVFQVIGLANSEGPMTLSPLRVALFWSAHLQRRVFETFDFAEHLREIHSSKVTDVVRHQEMAERIRKWEQGELAQAKRENRERQRRLEEIRKARFETVTMDSLQTAAAVPMLDTTTDENTKRLQKTSSLSRSSFTSSKRRKSLAKNTASSSPEREEGDDTNDPHQSEGKDAKKATGEKDQEKTNKNNNMFMESESGDNDEDYEEEEEEEELDEFGFVKTHGDDEDEDGWIDAGEDEADAALVAALNIAPEASLREKIEVVVDAVAASLSKRSYEDFSNVKEKHPDSPYRRLLTSISLLAETHTADITLLIQLINCANSGTIFDSLLPAVGLAFAFVRTPWPPSWYWRLCIIFSMISVVTKTCLSLMATEIQFTDQAKHWLQVVIFKVPEEVSAGDATSGTLFLDLGLDFTILFFVLVHRYLSRRLGLSDESFSSSTHASTALSKSFMQNLVTRFGVGIDLYTLSVTLDGLCFLIVLFGYYSLFPDDSASSVLDSFKSNLLPGPLVVSLLGLLVIICIDRVIYLMQAAKAKFTVHVMTVIVTQTVYIWWRNVLGVHSFTGVLLLLLKMAGSYLSATQLRRGYPLVKQHDPFSARPYPPFSIIYPIYRGIPFLFEMRSLLDWTFTRTSLPCHYWVKLEDIAHEVYNRNIDRYDHTKTNPSPGFATKFIWKFGLGFLVFLGLFFVMFFPLMYYSTFNPSLVDNEILEAEVQCTFGPISTWFRGRIAKTFDQAPSQSWVSAVRPSFIEAMRSSGSTAQLFDLSRCSTFNWQISPPALQTLRQRLIETAYPGNFSRGVFEPLQFRNTVDIRRKGSVTPEGKTASFVREIVMTPEIAQAFIILTEAYNQSNKYDYHSYNNNNGTAVRLAVVKVEDFWFPIISSDPNTASLFNAIKTPCEIEFFATTDLRTGELVQYSCVSCAPLFSLGNTPNRSYPEYDSCLKNPTNNRGCSKFNYDKNATRVIPPTQGGQSLYFYVVNERVPTESGFLPNVGIVALYTTFVIAIWRIVRGLFSGMAFKVVLEDMADPDKVKELIDLIYLSRESKRADALLLEEALYFELLDMLRGPDGLLNVTGLRSAMQLQGSGKNNNSIGGEATKSDSLDFLSATPGKSALKSD